MGTNKKIRRGELSHTLTDEERDWLERPPDEPLSNEVWKHMGEFLSTLPKEEQESISKLVFALESKRSTLNHWRADYPLYFMAQEIRRPLQGKFPSATEGINRLAKFLPDYSEKEIERIADLSNEQMQLLFGPDSPLRHECIDHWLGSFRPTFSEEILDRLCKELLPKYDRERVLAFLIELARACELKATVKTMMEIADHRSKMRRIHKHLEDTIRYLQEIAESGGRYRDDNFPQKPVFELIPISHFKETWFLAGLKELSLESSALTSAKEALPHMEDLVKILNEVEDILEERKASPYRPKADADGFVQEIAEIFIEHLDRPTTYYDGPFAQVVRLALKTAGLRAKDPSRSIRKAVTSLSNR